MVKAPKSQSAIRFQPPPWYTSYFWKANKKLDALCVTYKDNEQYIICFFVSNHTNDNNFNLYIILT
jgi:hypothetical protein